MQKLLAALKAAGIEELTAMQRRARELILSGRDVIIVAPTGSGKTEAAIIPIFEKLLLEGSKGISVLYITPLRALNRDMMRRLVRIARQLGLSVDVRHGDTPEGRRLKQSRNPPDVMITTPETFQLLFLGRRLREHLKNVRFVVVDEVHELADSERGAQLAVALQRLREYAKFQTIALSATVSDARKVAEFFGMDAEVVSEHGGKKYEFRVVSGSLEAVRDIIESSRSTLVFVNTRQTAEALGVELKKLCAVEVHHSSLSRDARIEAEEKFARGELKALICTSSMELGIDIGHVDVVVQYNSPRQVVRLLQRVGRSGHGLGDVSRGYVVADNFDDILESVAIIDLAEKGFLEEPEFHYGSLDVLANQICALAIEYGRIEVRKAYEIIRRARPFRFLGYDEFEEVCRFLAEVGRIYFDGQEIAARRRTRSYFYDNISMIPDEKHYKVVDISSGRTIGVLDEGFLSTFSGEVFTMKGELWRVLTVDGDIVKVEPYSGEGEIPSWVGEEIPVPFEVAQRVGMLRKELSEGNYELLEKFADEKAIEEVRKVMDEQKSYPLPTHEVITVEGGESVVLNACFGHKVNEALGRILALLLSLRYSRSVSVEVDPYRIRLFPARSDDVAEVLRSLQPESVESLAERALIDTRLFQWKVVNAARKFGVLEKGDDISRINLKNLVARLRGTPVYREALREVFLEKMDLEKLKEILENLDDFELVISERLSPISLVSRPSAADILSVRPQEAILKAFKERILSETCVVKCLNCGASYRETVANFSRFSCIKCGSRMIAVYNSKRSEPSRRELVRIANLVRSYGIRAVYAMNTYGVGAETAARILARYYENDDEFFKALMRAEREFVRTRKFWD
ncbi:MAG: DEAD/DEAH box helicase [Archaeoglobaceae archaeon]